MRHYKLLLSGLLLLAFLTVMQAEVHYTDSDPRGTLLVSDALISHGTIRLDHLGDEVINRYGYVFHEKNGHHYYYFPIGTSLVSTPVVAVAKLFGVDMLKREKKAQVLIAALVAVATLWTLVAIARRYLPPGQSLLVAGVFWFGTAFASTGGTALWSHNFAALFALLAIYLALRNVGEGSARQWPLLSLLLFLAYLCRPTLALLAPFLILFLFVAQRLVAVKVAGLLALLLLGFVGFSYGEFGQPLPDYYLPSRLSGMSFQDALYGNLFSSARGLFVYSPFLLVLPLLFKPGRRFDVPASWLLLGLAWPVVHLLAISRFPHWWAGWSYGPRFMMDVLPGLYLLVLRCWPSRVTGMRGALGAGALALTWMFALYVNTYQGLYNKYSSRWNQEPKLEENAKYLFDWTYPQFLHNAERHAARLHDANRTLSMGQAKLLLDFGAGEPVRFLNWSGVETAFRWNDGLNSAIEFVAPPTGCCAGKLTVIADYLGSQTIHIAINGHSLGSYEARNTLNDITLDFPPEIVRSGQMNRIEFHFPDARKPPNHDPRLLAMALKAVEIR